MPTDGGMPSQVPRAGSGALHRVAEFLHAFPDDHPFQIALRTYALSLSLSLGPALIPFVVSAKARARGVGSLLYVLKRELGIYGFAFAMTVGVGGGAALKHVWKVWETTSAQAGDAGTGQDQSSALARFRTWIRSLKDTRKTFITNACSAFLAILLLQSRKSRRKATLTTSIPMTLPSSDLVGRASPTFDLTLLILVRAADSITRYTLFKLLPNSKSEGQEASEKVQERRQVITRRIDALVFWACSARIMWCFFYEPQRLPRSYNKWIMSLANIDPRILGALRAIRSHDWSYTRGTTSQPDLVSSLSRDLGYPSQWGDITRIPAFGGPSSGLYWDSLSVTNRNGLGGIPCELVHGGVTGGSCTANAMVRGGQAFAEALAIYLPAHILPILLTRPWRPANIAHLKSTLWTIMRSASFLSTFVSSIWLSVCLTRTLLLARLFPFISHDFWDGPFGCTFAGSLICGSSIWIEQGRRRGEMALYVLPRAIRACLSERWLRDSRIVRIAERLTFVLSMATILTMSAHCPESLRGLSRWTLAFVMHGPNAGFWKRKRGETTVPPTSSLPDVS